MKWLDKILLWRAPFLPKLRLSQWCALWGANFAVMVVYWIGRYFDKWPANDTLATATMFIFFLLAVTPLDFSGHRTIYVVRIAGTKDDFAPVSRREAWQLRSNPAFEVHRVIVKDGEIVRGERLT